MLDELLNQIVAFGNLFFERADRFLELYERFVIAVEEMNEDAD